MTIKGIQTRKLNGLKARMALVLFTLLSLSILLTNERTVSAASTKTQECVPNTHNGTITSSQQWCAAQNPHILNGNVTIASGVTLTIEAGVIVQGANDWGLLVEGRLEAIGTATQPITFTSMVDSGPEQWGGIAFDGSSGLDPNDGTGHLSHVTVRYAGQRNSITDALMGANYRSNLAVRNGTLQLENVVVSDLGSGFNDYGLVASNSHLVLNDTIFTGIGGSSYAESDVPIRLMGPDTILEMSGCIFTGNVNDRVLLDPGAMMGHNTTLAAQPQLDGYEFREDFTVPEAVTLTLEPGTTLMGGIGSWDVPHNFIVQGTLQALGTAAQPITFTSVADNGPGQWNGLAFDGGTGYMRHATVRYGGQRNIVTDQVLGANHSSNIVIRNGLLQLEDVVVSDIVTVNHDYGLVASESRLVISNTLFTNIGGSSYSESDVPVRLVGPDTLLEMSGCVFSGNVNNRVLLDPGAMMGHDTTLVPQPQLDGYEFREDFTIPEAVTLTLEPGVTLMGGIGSWDVPHDFIVQGTLQALGTPAQPITFTSVADSGPGQWNGLAFDGGAGYLRNVTVRYGGQRNSITDALVDANHVSNLAVRNGSLRLENSIVRDLVTNSNDYGLVASNSQLFITDTEFTGIGGLGYADTDVPMRIMGTDTVLEMSGCKFTGNANDRVLLDPGAMMGRNVTLTAQPILDGYEFREDFTIPRSITLTVEPNVTLMGGIDDELFVLGNLEAIGTPTEPITFTSVSNSGPCQWSGLVFNGSQGGGTGHLKYATVRYGGRGNSVFEALHGYHSGSNITVYDVLNGQVFLENVLVEHEYFFDGWHLFADHGLYIHNGNVSVKSSMIQNNCDSGDDDSGIYVSGKSFVLIDDSLIHSNSAIGLLVEENEAFVRVTGSSIVNNVGDGVCSTGDATVILSGDVESGNAIHDNQGFGANQEGTAGQIIAAYNWWGDASGPTHSGNPGGQGEDVTDRVLYNPWLLEPPSPPTITKALVWVAAPNRIAVGTTTNLGIFFQNILTETLTDTLVVLELPKEVNYLNSTQGGEYWPEKHRVQWKLGDMDPGETFAAIAQVQFKWGIKNGSVMRTDARVAAGNMPSPYVAYTEQIAYQEISAIEEQGLSQAEVDTLLAGDSDLNALFDKALGMGFEFFGNAVRQMMSDGTARINLILIDREKPGEVLAIRKIGDDIRYIRHETPTGISFYTETGGSRFDMISAKWDFWGDAAGGRSCSARSVFDQFQVSVRTPNECGPMDWGGCVRNCLIASAPSALAEDVALGGSKCNQCLKCTGDCLNICSDCARDLWNDYHDDRYSDCTKMCADSDLRDNASCDGDKQECYTAEAMGQFGQAEYRLVYHCDPATCSYTSEPTLQLCQYGCIYGDAGTTGVMNTDCEDEPCPQGGPLRDPKCIKALTAKDPNAMAGPLTAAPGQTISYTIECENEGAGTAYGVFIEAELPAGLDDSTLRTAGGVYYPGTGKLFWDIGELAPGSGDSVTFTVQVPVSAISGTIYAANATVYFPSVPETTPTNPVVTLVQDIAAIGQDIETQEGAPVGITLGGYSPSGNPLTFSITDEPANGILTGTAPDLIYTPAENFEGLDDLVFTVADGAHTSRPARVGIMVQTGAESIPPEVVYTLPRAGETDINVFKDLWHDGYYRPTIRIMFSEPISATTITTGTLSLENADGRELSEDVWYNDMLNTAYIYLNEPLTFRQNYTGTVTTGVYDTSGNPLGADYVWTFSTEALKVYLPLVLRAK